MHEFALAVEIIDQVTAVAEKHKALKVSKLHLQIGSLSGVVKDAMDFCLDSAKSGTLIENAEIILEEIPLKVRCNKCGQESFPQIYNINCSQCLDNNVEIIEGKEFKIKTLEVD